MNHNDLMYWVGLSMLFLGLSLTVSVGTALTVVGSIFIVISIVSSFFVTWLSVERK